MELFFLAVVKHYCRKVILQRMVPNNELIFQFILVIAWTFMVSHYSLVLRFDLLRANRFRPLHEQLNNNDHELLRRQIII